MSLVDGVFSAMLNIRRASALILDYIVIWQGRVMIYSLVKFISFRVSHCFGPTGSPIIFNGNILVSMTI